MNILIIAHFQNDGSPCANFVHNQVKEYIKLGHSVKVIVPIPVMKRDFDGKRVSHIIYEKIVDEIHYFFIRYLSFSIRGELGINSFFGVNSVRIYLKKILKTFSPDIIHAHTLSVDTDIAFYLKKKLFIPIVVTTHGTDFLQNEKKLSSSLLTERLDKIDTLVTVSKKLGEQVGRYCKINPRIIINGANIRTKDTVIDREKNIVFVGGLIKQKNVDKVICAVNKLNKEGYAFSLKIIGEGVERDTLEKMCKEMEMNSVSFLGHLENEKVIDVMENSEYFVMVSEQEALGIVYLEAMGAGCITIGTKGEGIDGVIIDGENGFLVEPKSENVYNIIKYCEMNKEMMKIVRLNAVRTARDMTWSKNAISYTMLFEELIRDVSN